MDSSDDLSLSVVVPLPNLFCHLLVHLINKVIVLEAFWLSCKDLINDIVEVLFLDLHVRAELEDLVAPTILAQQVSTHRMEEPRAVVHHYVGANLGITDQADRAQPVCEECPLRNRE